MPAAVECLDPVFRALVDPTRREVVRRLAASSASVSHLAAPYEMSLPSFVQHLRVLEISGIVESTKSGRVRTYQLVPQRLRVAEDWLAEHRSVWDARLDRFADYVHQLEDDQR
jgi:DNA-binding transcriptional ArsR family regulator